MPGEKLLYIIGIDHYQHPLYRDLSNAVIDAQRFSEILLDKYGYTMAAEPLFNSAATLDGIREGLEYLANKSYSEDSIIVYYAGHGIMHPDSRTGYWVPYDGAVSARTLLDHSTVMNDLRKIKSKHLLLISDSCYSGTFITQTRGSGLVPNIEELEGLDSRWIFVSGHEEGVLDGTAGEGSPFSRSLFEFLRDNTKPAITALELFDSVTRLTQNLSRQKPQCEPMYHGHQGGQLVFRTINIGTPEIEEMPLEKIEYSLPENVALLHYIPRSVSAPSIGNDNSNLFFDLNIDRNYLDNLLETERRLVLLGTAGMGKSIELLYRAKRWEESNLSRRSIFLRFNTYTMEDITNMLPEYWDKLAPNDLYLFFDGLDEIQPENFHTAVRKLSDFQQRNPLIGIIVSCRTNFYELPGNGFSGTLPDFRVFHLNNISYAEIVHYAEDKYNVDGEVFLQAVHDAMFSDLVQKPFFLNVLLSHYTKMGNLKISRSLIMDAALIDGYHSNREHFHSTGQNLPKSHTFNLLEKIAFITEVMGKNYLKDEELAALFPLAKDYQQCKYLPSFTHDEVKEQWYFDHNNIQEYLASRVLAKRGLEEIITLISAETTGERKVKPHWVNTLSFLISTADSSIVEPLLAWLVENDKEIIVRFEPDRVTALQRLTVFRLIYEYYSDKKLWLYSNKFTDRDLANFGSSDESLEYLLVRLESDVSDRNNRLNALSVLRHFQLAKFPGKMERVKAAVLKQLEIAEMEPQDIYLVMKTISGLGLNDIDTVSPIIARYGQHRNQYIRTGLYNLISNSKDPDQFVDVYLDGMDINSLTGGDERSDVTLMDESFSLTRGLSELKSAVGISRVFKKLTIDKHIDLLYLDDHVEMMEKLTKSAAKVSCEDPEVYKSIVAFFHKEMGHHRQSVLAPMIAFFKETGMHYQVLKDTWDSTTIQDFERSEAINVLVDQETFILLATELASDTDSARILDLYNFFLWNRGPGDREDFLSQIESLAKEKYDIQLERPVLKDWQSIFREKNQESFDILFNRLNFRTEINRVFSELEKVYITKDDLFKRNLIEIETPFNTSAIHAIRHLIQGVESVHLDLMNEWLNSEDNVLDFTMGQIYLKLVNQSEISVTLQQKEVILDWCKAHPWELRKVWFFLFKLELELPAEQMLGLTKHLNHSNESKLTSPGQIEQLEKYLNPLVIKKQVIENIREPIKDELVWLMNVGYAFRKDLTESYDAIVEYLESNSERAYTLHEALRIWYEKTRNTQRLKRLIERVSSPDLRWAGINLLEESDTESAFREEVLHKIMIDTNETITEQIRAANHLLGLNRLDALEFLADRIMNHPTDAFNYHVDLGHISLLRDKSAVPILMKLLYFAKLNDKEDDRFNSLESPVLSGLMGIGSSSTANFIIVKTAVLEFIHSHLSVFPNTQYLHFTLGQIEDELMKKQSLNLTFNQAIDEYEAFIQG